MLMKVGSGNGTRSQIKELTEIFRGRIVDVSPEHVMIEISGRESKIEAFIEQMRPFGILEMVRTGRIAMLRDAAFTVDGPTGDRPPVECRNRRKIPSLPDFFRHRDPTFNRSQTPIPRPKMPAKIYYEADADLSLLKNKTIAILGYGSQGHAQAQNLRDSGCKVIIGQRPGSANYDLAVSHDFQPVSLADATKAADIVNILLPDEVQGDLFRWRFAPICKRATCSCARTDSIFTSVR